jgi:hypothetical protein
VKTIRFAHLDSAMRIVWEPDRTPAPADEKKGTALQAVPRAPLPELRRDARVPDGEPTRGG